MTGWTERRWAWLAVALVAILYLLINPAGYAGGGGDDARYLAAARCWTANGVMCSPTDHWATRWPGIASLTAAIAVIGDERVGVSFGALPWWIAVLALTGWLGSLWFGIRAGLLAAAILATVPITTNFALRPNTDLPELAAQLATLALAIVAIRRKQPVLALLSGVTVGIAIAARETSLLFALLGALAWLRHAPDRRGLLAIALVGFTTVIVGEMVAYWLVTGDPLTRYHLALAHGRVPSEALESWVDTSRSPILNPDFIGGWIRPLDIHLWWLLDAWLNLVPNPMVGPWIFGAAVLAWFAGRDAQPANGSRYAANIGIFALLLAGGLIYGLAIDPRPRAFMFGAAAAAIILGWAGDRLFARDKWLVPSFLLVSLAALGAFVTAKQTNSRPLEQSALAWIAAYPGQIEIDAQTRGTLALLPGARDLPPQGSGKPLRMSLRLSPCEEDLRKTIARGDVVLVAGKTLAAGESLCLLRYSSLKER